MDFAQIRGIDPRVDLRRGEIRMPQKLLDHTKIRASFQEMRRKAVSQRVR
jgi:hypothetical protein